MPLAAPLAAAIATAAGQGIATAGSKAVGAFLSALASAAKNGTSIRALSDLSRPARVEPMALIEQSLQDQEYMQDIAKLALSTFTGYYMQAVSMLMNVGRIDTLKVFDTLNPERSVAPSIKEAVWSQESYADGLPDMSAFRTRSEPRLLASLEAFEDDQAVSIADDMTKKLYEAENLAVGKLVNVELKDGDEKVKLPVIIRLLPAVMNGRTLTHIFTAGGRDSWSDRWQLARAGLIRPIKDLVFGIDLIDEHRKALMNDNSGAFAKILDRRRNNTQKQLLSGKTSAADASNIAIITTETAKEIGRGLYGDLKNKAVRDKIFDNSYLLLLFVVNEKWEKVTIYHRGLDVSTEYTFKEIKGQEKGKGQDITEIFKFFNQSFGANV